MGRARLLFGFKVVDETVFDEEKICAMDSIDILPGVFALSLNF